jgi:hypothetical protein
MTATIASTVIPDQPAVMPVEEARELWRALADRFVTYKLLLYPKKTNIVYCNDANRRGRGRERSSSSRTAFSLLPV